VGHMERGRVDSRLAAASIGVWGGGVWGWEGVGLEDGCGVWEGGGEAGGQSVGVCGVIS
jgi:hypothetical protein